MSEVDNVQAQIAAGQSLSAQANIGTKSLVGIVVPANWTTAGISLQASLDGGATWFEVETAAGPPFAIGSLTGGTARYVAIDPTTLRGAVAIKVRSGTAATPVNQTNAVTLQLVTRLVV